MNMFKKNGGFTLVELIVVIAILAILAAVAIPAYSGYITKAQEANDMTLLDSVKTATVFAVMEKEPSAQVSKIVVKLGATATDYTVEATVGNKIYSTAATDANLKIDISSYFTTGITFKSGNKYAELDYSKATATNPAKWELKPTAPTAG